MEIMIGYITFKSAHLLMYFEKLTSTKLYRGQ